VVIFALHRDPHVILKCICHLETVNGDVRIWVLIVLMLSESNKEPLYYEAQSLPTGGLAAW
jgi:hypothetical protein